MFKYARFLVSLIIGLSALTLFSANPIYASTTVRPQLIWQRSTEAQDKVVQETVIGSKVNEALTLPLDPNQTVFDNGVSTPAVNKNAVAGGISWASWAQYSSNGTTCGPIFDLRHFQAKFNLNVPIGTIHGFNLKSPYYAGNRFPINDNAYIFLNGTKIAQVGTSYGATNLGFNGTALVANETDGWVADGNFGSGPVQYLHAAENTIDVVAGEWCSWGGMGKLELELAVEGTFLDVPYFDQTSSPWGDDIYDNANTLNLDCEIFGGSTIAACGCAVTSSAMILKYYGVDKSPTGESTDPRILNNWLKNPKNKGYINGNVDWFAVARYSKQAHNIYGTPIIDYVLPNLGENFSILNQELENGRPVILKEPGHFILATGVSGQTYFINDPRWQNRETLLSYGNRFQEMRRFIETHSNLSGILIATQAPVEFLVIDQQGRMSGKDPNTGEVFNDIPSATYHLETPLVDDTFENTPVPPASNGTFLFEAADPESGQYQVLVSGSNNTTITFRGYDQDGEVSEQLLSTTGITDYIMDYSSEQGSRINVTQTVDIDIKPGSDPNSINLKSNGLIPVAFLTTPGFDVTQVDASTVRFGAGEAVEAHGKGHLEDVDGDGDIDLMLHFKTQETGIQNSDTQACLNGITSTGVPFEGCDPIQIVPK